MAANKKGWAELTVRLPFCVKNAWGIYSLWIMMSTMYGGKTKYVMTLSKCNNLTLSKRHPFNFLVNEKNNDEYLPTLTGYKN
jgi:hypothetical protein